MVYRDNVGDVYDLPEYLVGDVKLLDDLITKTIGTSLHDPLVVAWEQIMEPYRVNLNG